MRLNITMLRFLVISMILLAAIASNQVHAASIHGRVGLAGPNGKISYGDWVRVFLTAKPIDVPKVELASVDIPLERRTRINSGHMEFYVTFRQNQEMPGYIVDNKLTRPDGTFAFHHIKPGRYYVLITFPTMIGGFKCAWQVAVDVVGGQTEEVKLNNENLALPAF